MIARHHFSIGRTFVEFDRLHHDRHGMALTEFALVLPVMLLMFLGGYQLMDAMACNRKVTITTRAAADLVSRSSNSTIYKANIDAALNASAQIMYPYQSSNALVRVSEITTDSNGNGTVAWSDAINGSKLTKSAPFVVPPTIRAANISLIYAEVYYNYTPSVAAYHIVPPSTLSQTVYMSPRAFASLSCSDCT